MGWIDSEGYHKGEAPIGKLMAKQQSTYKDWEHGRQRKDHARELIQPYDRHGKPNEKFIEAWPTEAAEYGFTPNKEDLKNG